MIRLSAPKHSIRGSILLSGSKSISNRLLVLSHILEMPFDQQRLSDSEDTKLLQLALDKIKTALKNNTDSETVIDIGQAGTDMRFLTALLAVTKGKWFLTGTGRMKQRPIGSLVTALRELGANIDYAGETGFPPLRIEGQDLPGGEVNVPADISSQFISALLLISPIFERGLGLNLVGDPVSRPYIDMTISLLQSAGVSIEKHEHTILVSGLKTDGLNSKENIQDPWLIESDWSSASYWYSICSLTENAELELSYLSERSLQSDSILPVLYRELGVNTVFRQNSILLSKQKTNASRFEFDFRDCPDLAQTIAVTCFGLGIGARLNGLSTLKIKETDRLQALKTELEKLGARVTIGNDFLTIEPSREKHLEQSAQTVSTYHDHRMAMSFAPLALVTGSILIEDQKVVQKSYPRFWDDLKSVGFDVHLQP
jgi:3-phosphoshikimate 1-carboxyvinyltransferase